MTDQEKIARLWKTLDQIDTAAADFQHSDYDEIAASNFAGYVRRKVRAALKEVSYPGEPAETSDGDNE